MSPTLDIAAATYDSLGAFVAADPNRRLRDETDIGDYWLTDSWPLAAWRAAWLPSTGELYLQRLGPVPPGGRIAVLGIFEDRDALDAAFSGWEAEYGTQGSIVWLLGRLGADAASLPGAATR